MNVFESHAGVCLPRDRENLVSPVFGPCFWITRRAPIFWLVRSKVGSQFLLSWSVNTLTLRFRYLVRRPDCQIAHCVQIPISVERVIIMPRAFRSEERRVGKECRS